MTAQTTKIMSGIIIPAATAPRDDLDELLECVLDESYMTYPATKPRSELKN